ncbi:MAG: sulfite exporter TauE/SafE family protein [Candidatus Zixiibacteriota bacterium]|nr:MAG: sulfite exporter TauE/SafE family protein [candidate division Zixibacteria bacterium]
MVEFPVSGVETYWWLPMAAAFCIACLSSIGGLSGAFLILPLQISVFGFVGPAVTSTTLTYNIFSIPSGVWRYYKENRMVWPLAFATLAGTLPGVFLGAIIRVKWLPDPTSFKPFAGLVLLYIAVRLARDALGRKQAKKPAVSALEQFNVIPREFSLKQIKFGFDSSDYTASTKSIFYISFVVGIVGGAYGIGGGALIAPILVTVFGLPIYTVAGATLFGTFVTSIAGAGFYTLLASYGDGQTANIAPDWLLGGLFGIGGAAGMYVGARLQRYMPARLIKIVLTVLLLFVTVRYLATLFGW